MALPHARPQIGRLLGRLGQVFCAALLVSAAAAAQDPRAAEDGPDLNRNLFSIRCPDRPPGEDIVVCGRRRQHSPYRLQPVEKPRFDPWAGTASVSRERNRLLEGELGGLGSCTNIGPGGMTGCHEKGVQRSRQQRGK